MHSVMDNFSPFNLSLFQVKMGTLETYLNGLIVFFFMFFYVSLLFFVYHFSPGQRARIRQDQYSKVKAHVRKDDGRVQAYGWSLPAKNPSPSKNTNQQSEASKTPLMGVPVPIYCRPLFEKEAGTKVCQ